MLAEALAEKGYVVLATNHPGTTSRDSLPERTVMIWERAKDMSEILNWAENPTIEGLSGAVLWPYQGCKFRRSNSSEYLRRIWAMMRAISTIVLVKRADGHQFQAT